jgi:uncharacterized protein
MDGTEQLSIRPTAGGAVLAVKASPGSSRERIVGVLGECLKVATAAAPEKGKANAAIAATLAAALGLGRRDVVLVAGATGPRKEFRIAGLSAEQVRQRLGEWSI